MFAYFNQQFVMTQVNKLKGMYFIEKGDQAYQESELKSYLARLALSA